MRQVFRTAWGPAITIIALTNYNVYFGTSRFSGKSWYQGYTGTGNENNYSFFSASGNDFILINLGYNPVTAPTWIGRMPC